MATPHHNGASHVFDGDYAGTRLAAEEPSGYHSNLGDGRLNQSMLQGVARQRPLRQVHVPIRP